MLCYIGSGATIFAPKGKALYQAKQQYQQAWEIISRELPLFPLWYPANMVVANKRIGNIKINASGDWSFVKDITVTN